MHNQRETGKAKSGAMASILSAAQGLHRSGVIDKATMRDYESLCLTSVPHYTSADVVRIRYQTKVSQNLFARRLNVSPSTVHQWESGQKRPSNLAAKLLSVVEKHGLAVLD
ncbi:MAG: transcriptional regulator [Comamonadaceae bacterium CG_4_9_14_0_8_um_filter_60_18]|nr:DNA-binding transcriptional regulator [Rhodoferax sp.]PIW08308.1 MAG: transcriptional regulator [Comamonadaceae bacterium CG17_big_fil_post_rev_8_21_14_2_50_60_13]PJC13561.1 MAG: transcriptional regulator [Comamonadaceae bacterium CG_4_9_14_0_8_um_filter_60_18]